MSNKKKLTPLEALEEATGITAEEALLEVLSQKLDPQQVVARIKNHGLESLVDSLDAVSSIVSSDTEPVLRAFTASDARLLKAGLLTQDGKVLVEMGGSPLAGAFVVVQRDTRFVFARVVELGSKLYLSFDDEVNLLPLQSCKRGENRVVGVVKTIA